MCMKEEKVILVDRNDREIGTMAKMEAHEKAMLHRAFSVFIFNSEGQLLLQRRSKGKYHSGGLWTNTVCSHPRPGENIRDAAVRRLREEMGFVTNVEEIFSFIYRAELDKGLTEYEFDHVFVGKYDGTPELNLEEADAFEWKYLSEIKTEIDKYPYKFTEWFKIIFRESYEKLLFHGGKLFGNQALVFEPYYEEKIWGGNLLKTLFGKNIPSDKTGESWEISAVPNKESKVRAGFFKGMYLGELWRVLGKDFFGISNQKAFPLLIKYIDAQSDLSVQVHPDDELARKRHNSYGKNETWYILHANPGSYIYLGFREGVQKEDYLKAVREGNFEKILNKIPVKAGDWFYIPAGTVHAIGAGIVLTEVQQSSDITYRIYDYNRKDSSGNTRPLHIEEAMEAINFDARPMKVDKDILQTPFFRMESVNQKSLQLNNQVFSIIINPFSENLDINGQAIKKGETALMFANFNHTVVSDSGKSYFMVLPVD